MTNFKSQYQVINQNINQNLNLIEEMEDMNHLKMEDTSNINVEDTSHPTRSGTKKKLKVAVVDGSFPYSTCKPDFQGITVDFWKRVADKYSLDYEFVCFSRFVDEALKDVDKGLIDVLLGDISVLHRRYHDALYSRPYYVGELYLFRKSDSNLFSALANHNMFLNLIFSVLAVVIVYTIIMMNILKLNFVTSLYRSLVYFFSTEPDVMPVKLKTKYFYTIKVLNTLWQVIVFILNAMVLSIIISTFVNLKDVINDDEINEISDINVISNTSYVDYVEKLNKNPIGNKSSQEILDKLANDKNQYWIEDYNIKINQVQKHRGSIELAQSDRPVYNDEYAFVVSRNHPEILKMINDTLIQLQDDGTMLRICKGYLYEHYDRCNL
jgi:ABC-type amino acid transport substrate-binding protein